MNNIFSVIIITLLYVVASNSINKQDGILQLTTQNFELAIAQYKFLLVKFYVPWCQHCKDLAPEYKLLSNEIQENQKSEFEFGVAEIDCDSEETKYRVRSYPTIYLFLGTEEHIIYEGKNNAQSILSWIQKQLRPKLEELKKIEDVTKWIEMSKNYIGVLYYAISQDDPGLDLYKEYVKTTKIDLPFAYTLNLESRQLYNISHGQNIIIYKCYEPERVDLKEPNSVDDIRAQLEKVEFPRVIPFGQSAIDLIFEDSNPALIMFIDWTEQKSRDQLKVFREIGQNIRDSNIVITFYENKWEGFNDIASFMGLNYDLPRIGIIDPRGQFLKYHFSQELKFENIKEFINQFEQGSLQPFFKSQTIPLMNDQDVKIVVRDSFKQIVLDSDQDVILELYAPWCPHCKKLEPAYLEIAQLLKINQNIIVAKMDATENDVDFVEFTGYPTILFFQNGSKDQPLQINQREIDDILEFVAQHTTYKWVFHPDYTNRYSDI